MEAAERGPQLDVTMRFAGLDAELHVKPQALQATALRSQSPQRCQLPWRKPSWMAISDWKMMFCRLVVAGRFPQG